MLPRLLKSASRRFVASAVVTSTASAALLAAPSSASAAAPSSSSAGAVTVLPGHAANNILTRMRDVRTGQAEFATLSARLATLLVEEALASLAARSQVTVQTPCGSHTGPQMLSASDMCAVSIMRSGDLLLEPLRRLEPGISVGKLLIQRDETKKEKPPIMFYTKLPGDIASKKAVLLLDPMLATAGSASMAISELLKAGVKEERILFVNCIACPEGISTVMARYPKISVITGFVDRGMDERRYIVPGLGDFGDRALGTTH